MTYDHGGRVVNVALAINGSVILPNLQLCTHTAPWFAAFAHIIRSSCTAHVDAPRVLSSRCSQACAHFPRCFAQESVLLELALGYGDTRLLLVTPYPKEINYRAHFFFFVRCPDFFVMAIMIRWLLIISWLPLFCCFAASQGPPSTYVPVTIRQVCPRSQSNSRNCTLIQKKLFRSTHFLSIFLLTRETIAKIRPVTQL